MIRKSAVDTDRTTGDASNLQLGTNRLWPTQRSPPQHCSTQADAPLMACAAARAGNGRAKARSAARRAVPARPHNDELKMQAATFHKRPRKTAGTAYRGASGL